MRNLSLDLLKVLACFCVVVLHTVGNDVNVVNSSIYYIAGCAVPIFFMVNGNLLLNKTCLDYRYVLSKIKNIIIVVLSWNLVISSLFLIKGKGFNPIIESLKSLIQQGYFYQFWFFGGLLIIYSILPIIHKIFIDNKKSIQLTTIFISVCIIIDVTSLISCYLGYNIIQTYFIQTFRVWTWMAYFLLGGLLGKNEIKNYINNRISVKMNSIILIIMTIIIVFYQYNIGHYLYKNLYAEYFYDNIFTFIWILSLFNLVYRCNFKLKKETTIKVIIENIMGIYILHATVINIINRFYNFNVGYINIILTICVFTVSLLASFIINKIPYMNKMLRI